MYYGHISLDVWNTLITSNPEFAYVRNVMLANRFGVHANVIKTVYTQTKKQCDALAVSHGIALPSYRVWNLFIANMADHQGRPEFNIRNALTNFASNESVEGELSHKIRDLFEKYPPRVHQETITAVQAIHMAGATLHIASNSNFISGHSMKPFLKKHFGASTFRSHCYSDNLGLAKPSTGFFYHVWQNMTNTNRHYNTPIHIGDDERYDNGSASVGIRPVIIKDPLDTARVLRDLLK